VNIFGASGPWINHRFKPEKMRPTDDPHDPDLTPAAGEIFSINLFNIPVIIGMLLGKQHGFKYMNFHFTDS